MIKFTEVGHNSKSRVRANKRRYELINDYFTQGNFLDIGCGDCKGWDYLDLKKFKQIMGIDINKELIKKNKKKFKKAKFYEMDVTKKLKFKDNSFDNICCVELIEHLKKPEILIKELFKIIKPEGKLIITTPNKSVSIKKFFKIKNPYHVREFSIKEFKELVSKYFDLIKIKHVFCTAWDLPFINTISYLYEKIMPSFLGTGMVYYLKPKK